MPELNGAYCFLNEKDTGQKCRSHKRQGHSSLSENGKGNVTSKADSINGSIDKERPTGNSRDSKGRATVPCLSSEYEKGNEIGKC